MESISVGNRFCQVAVSRSNTVRNFRYPETHDELKGTKAKDYGSDDRQCRRCLLQFAPYRRRVSVICDSLETCFGVANEDANASFNLFATRTCIVNSVA